MNIRARCAAYYMISKAKDASKAQIHDLQTWLEDRPNIVEEPELEFSECEDDLITARPHSLARSRWWPRRSSTVSQCGSATTSRAGSAHAKDGEVFAASAPMVSTAEVLMLVSPAWAMAFTCGETERIVIWGLFTVLFVGLAILNKRMTARNRFVAIAGQRLQALPVHAVLDRLRWQNQGSVAR
ncbi:hypothetical protein AC578_9596 [Pseudocercospora eumusae]|uniref:DUF6594 domain-containing protein n=1 Tax=Pseudocercospora eumusae TaxID=321146 RepID=A0A139GY48_9PEZI|nr:hypothetical protein AC578_9596 [Pseudocercospora eumusae]